MNQLLPNRQHKVIYMVADYGHHDFSTSASIKRGQRNTFGRFHRCEVMNKAIADGSDNDLGLSCMLCSGLITDTL